MRNSNKNCNALEKCEKLNVPERIGPAISVLRLAYDYARRVSHDLWEFSVPTIDLAKRGLEENDLRWLVLMGFILCRSKSQSDSCHNFKQPAIRRDIHAILTQKGARFSSCILKLSTVRRSRVKSPVSPSKKRSRNKPVWDPLRRTLVFRRLVIKELKRPATVQEIIFDTFQECGWPECIDDPLPPKGSQSSKKRLHDAINNLNRYQKNPLIRFFGTGNGTAIGWQLRK